MKVLLDHFRAHGVVHAVWTIAILLSVIAALILMSPNGNAVGQYIAFATSIASLVLAVVAIGQSLIANQSFSETVGVLRSSASNVETGARNIVETSAALSQQADRMLGEISGLPPAFKEISAKIDALQAPQGEPVAPLISASKAGKPGNRLLDNSSAYGVTIGLYVIARAVVTKKAIQTSKIFPPKGEWDYFVAGVLHTIRTDQPLGIELSFAIPDDGIFIFTVTNAGSFDYNSVIEAVEKSTVSPLVEQRGAVDAYFAA